MQKHGQTGELFMVIEATSEAGLVQNGYPWLNQDEVGVDDLLEELWRGKLTGRASKLAKLTGQLDIRIAAAIYPSSLSRLLLNIVGRRERYIARCRVLSLRWGCLYRL
jgi:hypothetical protein